MGSWLWRKGDSLKQKEGNEQHFLQICSENSVAHLLSWAGCHARCPTHLRRLPLTAHLCSSRSCKQVRNTQKLGLVDLAIRTFPEVLPIFKVTFIFAPAAGCCISPSLWKRGGWGKILLQTWRVGTPSHINQWQHWQKAESQVSKTWFNASAELKEKIYKKLALAYSLISIEILTSP